MPAETDRSWKEERAQAGQRLRGRRDELLAALGNSALAGDTRQARAVIGKLLKGVRGEPLVDGTLADALASAARDFDTSTPAGHMSTAAVRTAAAGAAVSRAAPPTTLTIEHPVDTLLVVDTFVQAALDRLLVEHERAEHLRRHGLRPTTRVLLTGVPGVGKSQAARWLAERMRVPLARIEPARVMSSLLGESARNLHAALDWARNTSCVLLVDEFDAFAKRRDDPTDVGELKRLVNMLLLELDAWDTNSVFIAATNHEHLLDPAVLRRFDSVLTLPLPARPERSRLIETLATRHGIHLDQTTIHLSSALTDGQSGSAIRDVVLRMVREVVLDDVEPRTSLVQQLRPPMSKSPRDVVLRARYCALLHDEARMSNREVARVLGLSAASVSELVRRGREELVTAHPTDGS